jgi:CheY-like chemotaxis protein
MRSEAEEKERTAHARVLLAENDQDTRELLADLLHADGHDVVEVSSGEEILRVLSEEARVPRQEDACDVIVTDHLMPNGDGLDAVEKLRREGCSTPVLLITAFADEGLRAKADDLETMVMAKPLTLPAFRTAVSVLLSLRASRGHATARSRGLRRRIRPGT